MTSATVARARAAIGDVLWGPESGRRVLFVHTALALVIGARIVFGPFRQLAGQPAVLFDPVPVLGLLDRMPSVAVIAGIQVVGGLAALAAALRRRPRLAFAVAWVCYLVLAGLRGSRGKVLHNDLLLLWASAPFLLAPLRVSWRDRVPDRRVGWPVRVAALITALVYFFAGYHKLRRSGPGWVFGDNMQYVMLWGPSVGEPGVPDITRWIGERLWASKVSAGFILGLELSFPIVLVVRRWQVWWAVAAVALHAGTWVVLGLDYWGWALTVSVVLVDWPSIVERARARAPHRRAMRVDAPPAR